METDVCKPMTVNSVAFKLVAHHQERAMNCEAGLGVIRILVISMIRQVIDHLWSRFRQSLDFSYPFQGAESRIGHPVQGSLII